MRLCEALAHNGDPPSLTHIGPLDWAAGQHRDPHALDIALRDEVVSTGREGPVWLIFNIDCVFVVSLIHGDRARCCHGEDTGDLLDRTEDLFVGLRARLEVGSRGGGHIEGEGQ